MAGVFERPRPVPGRRIPALAAAALILLALPVFVVAGFPLGGWALAAVLWLAGEVLMRFLGRLPTGPDDVLSSALVGVATAFRGIGVMIVLLIVTVVDKPVGISAVVVYALAYSLSLAISLVEYFVAEPKR
jgi:hypothetical protein